MEQVPVLLNGQEIGVLDAAADGLYVCYRGCCRLQTPEILRLYAVGERSELCLGTPEPQNGVFHLTRRVSARENAGIGKLVRGELRSRLQEDQWRELRELDGFSERLRRKLENCGEILIRQEGDLRFLAIPFACDKPFPLTDWFCLAQIRQLRGGSYAVYAVDGEDRPIFPKSGIKNQKNRN